MSIQLRDGLANQLVDHVLEDLLVRFVINVPDEDLSSIERVFFQVEEAQWFYSDFCRQLNPALPGMKMKRFAPAMLSKCPLLWKWGDPADALSQFGKYKRSIPVRGIALMNEDLSKIVLVQGSESLSWSFPRGKISKDESDLECAIREVREETGFDARDYVNEKDVIERNVYGKNFKIFLAKGVPVDFPFEPLVRNEIAKIQWFDVKALAKMTKQTPNKFFIVNPFLKPLNSWINKNKGVVSEEQLKRDAEVRLKALMGISDVVLENTDAGRELLDLLQGAAKAQAPALAQSQSQPQHAQYIQMNVPQHLQNFYAGMGPAAPFVPPMHPQQGYMGMMPPRELLRNYGSVPPNFASPVPRPEAPASIARDTLNSKELLSILKGGPKPKREAAAPVSGVNRAEELLKLFKKEPETGKDKENKEAQDKEDTDNNKELNSNNSSNNNNGSASKTDGPKITLLKRAPNEDALATLLELLGKRPDSQAAPKPETIEKPKPKSNASAELLGLLKREKPKTEPEAKPEPLPQPERSLAETQPQREPQENSSTELLAILNRKQPETREADKNASAELLGILNKPIRIARRDKDSPVDLKSIIGSPETSTQQSTPAHSSDPGSGNRILSTVNRKSTPNSRLITPQMPIVQPPLSFDDFEDFDDICASENVMYQSIANNMDDSDDDNFHSAVETANASSPEPERRKIARGRKDNSQESETTVTEQPIAEKTAMNPVLNVGSLQETYGGMENISAPPHPGLGMHTNSNGASLLQLLGRRPPEPKPADGREELLSILKSGRA